LDVGVQAREVQRSRGEVPTVNFPFIVVVVAAIAGVVAELALRRIAPESGPVVALVLMAAAVLIGAVCASAGWPSLPRPVPSRVGYSTGANESLNSV